MLSDLHLIHGIFFAMEIKMGGIGMKTKEICKQKHITFCEDLKTRQTFKATNFASIH